MLWTQSINCSQETKNVATQKFLLIHFRVMCEVLAKKIRKKVYFLCDAFDCYLVLL